MISNNPGFYAGTFVFEYDNTELTYLDYEKGDILDEYEVELVDGKISSIVYSSKNADVKKDGTLMVLKFKAKKAPQDGAYKITIDKDGTMMGSFVTEKEVKADISCGKVTVK